MADIRFRQTAPSRLPRLSLVISPLAIALIALAQAGEARGEPYHEDDAFGKTYKSYLDYDTILKSPAWDQEIDSPPALARKAIKLADKMLRREAAQGLKIDGKESSPEFHRGGPLRLAHHVGGGADRMMPDRLGYHEINLVMLMGAVIKSAWSATTKRPQNNLGLRLTHH